jgi:Mannosylglycerate hydrolase MGH1-like glycoside hydrolase domain
MTGVERARVESFGHPEDGLFDATPWYQWGPYLSERAWGTVREDYSADGSAWDYFPHDHARSRAFRWGEDGMAGVSDVGQQLCMALALWNGRDPILKERMFGLTGPEGNHGEDVKEYWWYLDALPSHAWLRWRYHYPHAEFPYSDLVAVNGRRSHLEPEYELLDTGVFDDDRYWVVEVVHAKADPHDLLMEVRVTNVGPEAATLHVLPHLWFRNTWSWSTDGVRPVLAATGPDRVGLTHPRLGELEWLLDDAPDGSAPDLLFCDNDTNAAALYGSASSPAFPKDGINDHVVAGAPTVNPHRVGTKAAAWYRVTVGPRQTAAVRVRLRPATSPEPAFGAGFDDVLAARLAEADEFYDEVIPDTATDDERAVARQAFAGMIWGKQFYFYDVARWLEGDPSQPPPPPQRRGRRNAAWTHLAARDILSMPDPWEYPWFAAWDLAFHTIALAHVDPAFAKYQLIAMGREWFQHPNGAIPAYEWAFGDVNPPVHAWAALHVWDIDGRRDPAFLGRLLPKLLLNFTWWVNRMSPLGDNVFSGGFLGLDNISAVDRSNLPPGWRLEQADGTSWMAFYSLTLLQMARILAMHDEVWTDLGVKFMEHFALIVDAMRSRGLWDEEDAFFYDVLHTPDGAAAPIRVRSMVGILPLLTTVVLGPEVLGPAGRLHKRFAAYRDRFDPEAMAAGQGHLFHVGDRDLMVLGVTPQGSGRRILRRLFDPDEFLSPHGLRALSRFHLEHPATADLGGHEVRVDYEPAESTSGMFGGNSNWRGPIWMPVNYLVVRSLQRNAQSLGADATIEYPTGSGAVLDLAHAADDLRRRLIALFLRGPDGRRPCHGEVDRLQDDPRWRDNITFFEYFHGDSGAGLGASHQTGWTGLVADLICRPDPFAADPTGFWTR